MVNAAKWGNNPIDAFILKNLEKNGLDPSAPADPYSLVRRIYLDLTGLPPTPQQADAFAISPKMANYSESGFNQTTEVGSFNPNPWGFHDMHGNVWELCLDKFGPYSNNLVIDPINLDSRTNHVIRGGGWNYDESKITSTMRHEYNPSPIFADSGQRGFRVALVQTD